MSDAVATADHGHDHGAPGSAHGPEEIQKHIRVYYAVFGALAVLTVVTVGVSYLHLDVHKAIAIALAIATVKASLVAAYFMHLISERKLIFMVLLLTAVFFGLVLMLPTMTESELPSIH